jgi:hypothetical protein
MTARKPNWILPEYLTIFTIEFIGIYHLWLGKPGLRSSVENQGYSSVFYAAANFG